MHRAIRAGALPTLFVATLHVTAARASAQESVTAYIDLKGVSSGQFKGESTNSAFKDAIVPYTLSVSPAVGSTPAVLHILVSSATAPQMMHALTRNERLVSPTVTFTKADNSRHMQPFYVIKAQSGYVQDAQIALDTQHVPAMLVDVVLGGSVSYSDGAGVATTSAAPAITGTLPSAATVITGEFTSSNAGAFPSAPSSPQHLGIPLDAASIHAAAAVSMPVGGSGAVSAGHAVIDPFVILRPSDQDAAEFAATQSNGNFYQKVVVHVYVPGPSGSRVEAFRITASNIVDGQPPVASGAAATKPGASAGLATGGTTARMAATAPLARIATTSAAPPVTMRLSGNNATLTVTNEVNQTTASIP